MGEPAWKDAEILRNNAGDPIPQVWDEGLGEFVPAEERVRLGGVKAEIESEQFTRDPTDVTTHDLPEGATQLEIYCESGYIRVCTNGDDCTATTGEPIAPGFGAGWSVPSVSVFPVQESVYTVVSR